MRQQQRQLVGAVRRIKYLVEEKEKVISLRLYAHSIHTISSPNELLSSANAKPNLLVFCLHIQIGNPSKTQTINTTQSSAQSETQTTLTQRRDLPL